MQRKHRTTDDEIELSLLYCSPYGLNPGFAPFGAATRCQSRLCACAIYGLDRTPDHLQTIQALSQLSYAPSPRQPFWC
jgi:hypothetical protein